MAVADVDDPLVGRAALLQNGPLAVSAPAAILADARKGEGYPVASLKDGAVGMVFELREPLSHQERLNIKIQSVGNDFNIDPFLSASPVKSLKIPVERCDRQGIFQHILAGSSQQRGDFPVGGAGADPAGTVVPVDLLPPVARETVQEAVSYINRGCRPVKITENQGFRKWHHSFFPKYFRMKLTPIPISSNGRT